MKKTLIITFGLIYVLLIAFQVNATIDDRLGVFSVDSEQCIADTTDDGSSDCDPNTEDCDNEEGSGDDGDGSGDDGNQGTAGSTPSTGTSSGASRVSIISLCDPTWECTGWSPCENGFQERTCIDIWDCKDDSEKPETYASCGTKIESQETLTGNENEDAVVVNTIIDENDNSQDSVQERQPEQKDGLTSLLRQPWLAPILLGIVIVAMFLFFIVARKKQ